MCVGGAGRQPPVPGGGLPGEEAGEPGIGPAARRGPVLAGGGAAAAAAALPPRPGPALPRLGRGNDLRGNLGRAGRERGRGGGAPGTLRRCPGDQRIQRGRPAGRWRPASPPPPPCPVLSGSTGEGRGLLSPGPAAASVPGALRLVPPAGLGRGEAAAGGGWGSRGAPVAQVPRAEGVWGGGGGCPCGSAGMGRGSRAAGSAPGTGTGGCSGAAEETRRSSPCPCDGGGTSGQSRHV